VRRLHFQQMHANSGQVDEMANAPRYNVSERAMFAERSLSALEAWREGLALEPALP
jgi:hypothetical protein